MHTTQAGGECVKHWRVASGSMVWSPSGSMACKVLEDVCGANSQAMEVVWYRRGISTMDRSGACKLVSALTFFLEGTWEQYSESLFP